MGTVLLVGGLSLAIYPIVLYPLMLWFGTRLRRRPRSSVRQVPESGPEDWPPVSITVPVYNEAHQIESLLESLVTLEYPADRRQILIVSDGSTDGTDEMVRQWEERGVELLTVEGRGGKGAAENAAREHLTGKIIVNTDASIRIRPDALLHLMRPFEDPSIGVVSGRDVSVIRHGADANTGEGGYVGYEMKIRDLETHTGGIVGASGCLYASRKHLHDQGVPPRLSRDFASALVARDRGYRAVSAPRAVCFVPRTGSLQKEYRRKVRTVARGMSTVWAWKHLMNPIKHPGFAWKLLSHKIFRWLLPVALLMIGLGLVFLSPDSSLATFALVGCAAAVLLGLIGWGMGRDERSLPMVLSVPAFFLMSNVAVVHAFVRACGRGSEALWEPTRRKSGST